MDQIKNIKPKQLAEGIQGFYVHGEKHTMGFVELAKGSIVPLHSHPHEQITYILEGTLYMSIGGVDYSMNPGMYHVIPSNVPHSAIAVTDCKLIDTFSPVREDYKT